MNIGDYVRTKQGYIAKIEDETNNAYWFDDTVEFVYEPYISIEKNKVNKIVIKSSPQIIDLIEVGDYVNYNHFNGGIVLTKTDDEIITNTILLHNLKNEDIMNVTTREQIETMQYRVEK